MAGSQALKRTPEREQQASMQGSMQESRAPSASAEARPVILNADGIQLAYHRKDGGVQPVLKDFSLTLREREVVALLGPSGVGKSTLLRVLAGLQFPDAGRVEAFGNPLKKPHPRVGVVFQDACLLPWKNVRGNVGIGLNFANQPRLAAAERRARVVAALDEVDLAGTGEQMPAALSGGMAQRVALARCLVRQPDILLLDEPFSALDAVTRATMQSLLLQVVRRHHAAAVLVTHDIDEALRVADRVLLLHGQPATLANTWTLPHATSNEPRPVPAALREQIVATLAAPGGRNSADEPNLESA